MRSQKVEIRDLGGNYREPISLKKYMELKKQYINYHLEDATGKNDLFRFSARDDQDAIECVKMLNWNGIYKLKRIDPNSEKGYELVGVFLDHVWNGN